MRDPENRPNGTFQVVVLFPDSDETLFRTLEPCALHAPGCGCREVFPPDAAAQVMGGTGRIRRDVGSGSEARTPPDGWPAAGAPDAITHHLKKAGMSGLASEPVTSTAPLEHSVRPVPRAWNATDAPFPADRCIHQLVEEQAARTPHAVAVVCENVSLTYRELNERANRLAHRLVRLGVGPEVRVGVCLERGAELVAALLAVLKAGGAYVPLDPAYPAERLELMLADAGVAALVTQEALRGLLPVPEGTHVVSVDGAAAEIGEASPENPLTAVAPRNLAYLIYTSGSTGRPKGVAIEHRSAAAMLAWAWSVYSAEELGGMLASTSVCFDMSVFELFAPLGRGGRVIVVENALALPRSAAADQVRLVDTVPSAIATLLETGGIPAGVKTVNLGGELLKPELVDALYAHGVERVYDLYGPSEDTTFSTYALRRPGAAPTIGRPIANTRCHVVDADLRPVGVGETGELYMAGRGITRGYLGRPGLTAERYLPDPFSDRPGARMYRTGDRVRWLADGTLEYLGRLDHQVKIRGYRVEPGEIEGVLREHAGVHDVVVAPYQPAAGGRRLAAYLVPRIVTDGAAGGPDGDGRQGAAELVRELKRAVRDRLPEYMVPSVFVPMERFPLSPNGKVDRRALPAPPERPDDVETPFVAPRTETEAQVAALWAEVLGVRELGVEDDVFALGAHSLAVTQVASRLRARLGVELPLRELFAAHTVAALAATVQRHGARPAGSAAWARVHAPRDGRLPLASPQERVWFLIQLAPDNLSYNFQGLVTFRGPLDLAALRASLSGIVRRHEVFRTTFPTEDGHPYQRVHPPFEVELPLVDLSALAPPERAAEEGRMFRESFAEAFDLATLPLVRWFLVRRGPEEHVLVHREHHMVHDGWSFHVFLRELLALYEAFSAGRPSPLPELGWQFGDYAWAQRRWMESDEARAQVEFWRRQLAGSTPVLTLPHDRPRPPEQRFRGAAPRYELPAELYRRLREASRRMGVTLFATMMAAYDVLLWRWSGQADLNVGTGIANRRAEETHELMGMFVNSVVVRARVEEDLPFAELARRVHAGVLAAAEHQEVPFEMVVEALRPDRSLGHNPLFQAMFSFHDSAIPDLRLPGVEVEVTPALGNGTSKFDLDVVAIPRAEQRIGQGRAGDADGITLVWEHNTDLFDAATMEAMARQYRTLLETVADEPERRVGALELLDDAERRRVLETWSRSPADELAGGPVHRMIEAQAARTPDAPAIVSGGDSISYAELNRRANRLAHHLRRLGVGPEVRVGVCLERGAELPVALLAVLKAGGAYVPLDPAYPPERLAFMLADSGASVLVAQRRTRDAVPAAPAVRLLDLDAARAEIAAGRDDAPADGAGPGDLAYVIYTSGSTGTPKGVGIEHRALAACLDDSVREYAVGPGDRVLQFHSASFDPAVDEIFATLLAGAAVVPLADALAEPGAFLELCRREGVTLMQLPTAVWHTLVPHLEANPRALPSALRTVVIGGEQALAGAVAAWRRVSAGRVRLLNSYGPTETTINCTRWDAPGAGDAGEEAAPVVLIGRPVPGCRTYVLDEAMRPLPAGVPGELYVGGVQVARGYLGRPAATAERFVPDPFRGRGGARLYRTGDRARWRPDGALEYLGRVDAQVKVRGFRVEPGEVEAALRRHPGVAECAVVARDAAPGEKRLVGYVVPRRDAAAVRPRGGLDELRAHLRRALPEHMVPGALVPLDALPLTPNGKVDYAALPAPEQAPADGAWVAPRTPVEEVLAGIWAQVLGRERVGAGENFFALGGHSLLATRVVSCIRAALGAELPVRSLFEAPTVAELAARVEAARRDGAAPLPPVVPVPRGRPLPLSFAQERLWFLHRLEPESAVYNVPTALRLSGALDAAALERALGEVVRRHETLRTTFAEDDGRPVQVIHPFAGFTLPVDDLAGLGADGARAAARRRAADEAARPFDLGADLPFRAALLRLGDDEHVLLLTFHHVASDGWSTGVLARELAALYAAYREGRASPLPDLPVQYADDAAWQRAHLRGEALERPLAWWRERLAGAPALLELPTDRPRPAVRTHQGALEPVALPAALADRLRALARAEGATPFMVILAAFQALLGRQAGTDDVVVGSPVAGRTRGEVEGLIGFFVNTLVLRTGLGGDPSFRALLGRVRQATLGAYDHQSLPFEKLVEELRPERSLAHAPLFQVTFALDQGEGAWQELADVRVEELPPAVELVKFDLSLALAWREGGLGGYLAYSTELFGPATVRRLLARLERVLEQVSADPGIRLSALELLDAAERRLVMEEWNRTAAAYPAERCIHQLVEEQAERTPHAVAVVHEADAVTYRELNARANRLAHRLVRLGVGPEVRVGVCLERGTELVVALLAVLKAGGAYVPLDPAYPAERLALMLADAGVAVLVTQEALRGLLPVPDDARVVSVDGAAAEVREASPENPPTAVAPRNLAYLIYTSGSTGVPKGVAIEHRSAVAMLAWAWSVYSAGELEGMLASTSVCFDMSVFELFAPLARGGRVIVVENALALPRSAAADQVRLVDTVPSAIAALLEADGLPPGVRTVNLGGEVLKPELVDALYARGVERVYDLYGPSEDTTFTTFALRVPGGAPTIGRPIANTRCYAVDGALRPVGVGETGELYIGGSGITRGYLGRPGLTAGRYLPDPFSAEPGARMYRTGDRVRWLADGTLEYLGRLDHQVKIRGYRVEPGEIEAVLRRHPGVSDCTVAARDDTPGDRRLVAWVVGTAPAEELRAHLRRSLPEYMVPAAFVALSQLPLSPNGKVDRGALPAPRFTAGEGFVAPRTPVEEVLAGIWAEVLGRERMSVQESFFEAGGHSLLAMRMVSRVRDAFDVELPVRALFDAPTVAAVAERVEVLRRAGVPVSRPVPRAARGRRLPR
jgi:amino acid adenylation domain-containing protein